MSRLAEPTKCVYANERYSLSIFFTDARTLKGLFAIIEIASALLTQVPVLSAASSDSAQITAELESGTM